jgi:hypothetical protein
MSGMDRHTRWLAFAAGVLEPKKSKVLKSSKNTLPGG